MFKALWNYRGVISDKVNQDFFGKYRRSVLGGVWLVLEPLSMIVIYTVIFSTVMGARLPGSDNSWGYSIYLCSGLLCWELFHQILSRSSNMFVEQANLIKKSSFPKSIFPLVISISSSLQYLVFLSVFTVFLLMIGQFPFNGILWLPLGFFALLLLATGMGLIAGVLNVFFRDIGRLVIVLLNFLFWGTPIVYTLGLVPDKLSNLILLLNPVASIIEYHHAIFVYDKMPDISMLILPTLLGIFFCLFGFWLFVRLVGEIVDEL